MATLGFHTESQIASGLDDLRKQAVAIEENLKNDRFCKSYTKARKKQKEERICSNERREIVALIAYMQETGNRY
jgi:cytochrome c oxidase cbb3-type subunit I/II